jgi:Xaa-Pro aminopeptidase
LTRPSPESTGPNWAGRLHVLREFVASRQLDAFVVSTPVNVAYLSGFTGSAGWLVVTGGDAWLITDGRYEAAVRQASAAGRLGPVQLERVEPRYDLTLAALLGRIGAKNVAFEAAQVTVATLAAWQKAASEIEWTSTDGVVERARMIKDAAEVATLRLAARKLSDVARQLTTFVAAGRTEREIAASIDSALDRAGFSQPAFPTIVASGPNSALPHARPTDRRLTRGDLVVLDFGGVLDGYCVDLTRTAGVGQVGSEAEALFAAVRDAQTAAIAVMRSGVAGSEVDAAARRVLEARGFGPAFLHSTGHGLGLEVHESPRLARAESGVTDRLEAGMVCTVEPGAYLEGLGGVRLEDDVLVTAGGCEVLTDAPRDLLVV